MKCWWLIKSIAERATPATRSGDDASPYAGRRSRLLGHIAVAALSAAILALPACNGSSTMGRSAVSMAKESQANGGLSYALGPQFESQLEEMISQEVVALGVRENVPMELNRQVLLNINYFLNDARGFMTKSLSRGSKYIPMMKAIFRQKGLPEDLVYLALIESGFKTAAVSPASAVGPWQFIASTGHNYGLTINEWVDERMDPVKSSYAAADYLTALHDMFNSWPLAIAAYNSGEGKILKGMKNYGVSNFWDMSSVGGHLAGETKLYVPSFLAATFIAKDPAAYGLQIDLQPPDQWEEVVVPTVVTFKEAAAYSGATVDRLKELNPHLKKESTPPDETDFVLRLPTGSSKQFAKAYGKGASTLASAKAGSPTLSTITHKVKSGDTLDSIAKRYGLSADSIKKSNSLSSNNIRTGQVLRIQSDLPLTAQKKSESSPLMVVETKNAPPRTMTTHTVAAGENLGGIALKYNMSLRELVDINQIEGTTIKIGQKLKVAGSPSSTAPAATSAAQNPSSADGIHLVTSGESVGGIAQKYGMKSKDLMALNNLDSSNIRIGQKLKVRGTAAPKAEPKAADPPAPAADKAKIPAPAAAKAPPAKPAPPTVHTVASGENVGTIAHKYGLSPKELMALNNMDNPTIRVRQKLKVSKPGSGSQTKTSATPSKPAVQTSGLHTVAEGESLGGIAQKYGMKMADLVALNQLPGTNIRIGQKLKVAGRPADSDGSGADKAGSYTVASGDTLYSIARKNQISVDELKKINKLEGDNVRPGQVLKLK